METPDPENRTRPADGFEAPRYPALILNVEANTLIATLKVASCFAPLTSVHLDQQLLNEKVNDYVFCEEARQTLLANARLNTEFSIVLAESRDAELELDICRDKMEVVATASPAFGGVALTKTQVIDALIAARIDPDSFDIASVDRLLESKEKITICIARGRQPISGEDTQFIPTFDVGTRSCPAIDKNDMADYFDTRQYVAVEKGELLMRRIPPGDGIPGKNVLGKRLKPRQGKNLKFKKHKGSIVSPDDENLLIAALKGHPVLETQGVKVDDTLTLRNADLKSGNINYDGSVMIQGDVMPQVKIQATGDIFVKHTVENATLIAGNNIVVCGGVISDSIPDASEPSRITTYLCAGSNIHALFMNLVEAEAGNDITVQIYTIHCNLKTGGSVLVGERNGTGVIVGGQAHAAVSITVNTIGSEAYIHTLVSCGDLPELATRYQKSNREIKKRISEMSQLKTILGRIKANTHTDQIGKIIIDKARKVVLAMKAIQTRLKELEAEKSDLEPRLEIASNAFVQVNKKLYPNTHITINDVLHLQEFERYKSIIRMEDGKVVID